MWDNLRNPNDPPQPLSKKRKKKGIIYEPYGLAAVHEKVTREYLTRSSTHTVEDEALAVELRSARRAYAQEEAERAKMVVIPVRTRYPGEGEPLPHGDPPIPETGRLPRPLGRSVPRMAGWVDVCPITDIQFVKLYERAKVTPAAERMREMITAFRRVHAQRRIDNPKSNRFGIHERTPADMVTVLRS
jgi:hypothetical protein